jgi:hypothetical protein
VLVSGAAVVGPLLRRHGGGLPRNGADVCPRHQHQRDLGNRRRRRRLTLDSGGQRTCRRPAPAPALVMPHTCRWRPLLPRRRSHPRPSPAAARCRPSRRAAGLVPVPSLPHVMEVLAPIPDLFVPLGHPRRCGWARFRMAVPAEIHNRAFFIFCTTHR